MTHRKGRPGALSAGMAKTRGYSSNAVRNPSKLLQCFMLEDDARLGVEETLFIFLQVEHFSPTRLTVDAEF